MWKLPQDGTFYSLVQLALSIYTPQRSILIFSDGEVLKLTEFIVENGGREMRDFST